MDQTKDPKFEGGGRPTDRIGFIFDNKDQLHIAYSQHTKVMNATRTNNGWSIQEIHDERWIIDKIDIIVKEGNPEIHYTTHDKNLKATWNGLKWENGLAADRSLEKTETPLIYKLEKYSWEPPLLQFNTDSKIYDVETVEPTTALVVKDTMEQTSIIYVGWTEDLQYPKNGQGLKYAELIK